MTARTRIRGAFADTDAPARSVAPPVARCGVRGALRASSSLGGADRAVKATVTAAAATGATLAAHVIGGADAPGLFAVFAAFALAALVALPLSGRAVSPARLGAIVAASQALFHLLFVLGTPSATTQTLGVAPASHGIHAAHAGVMMLDGAGPLAEHALHLTPQMLVAHLVAGLLVLVLLHCGERALEHVAAAARGVWRGLRRLVAAASDVPGDCGTSQRSTSIPWSAPARPRDVLVAWQGSRRGPPLAHVVTLAA